MLRLDMLLDIALGILITDLTGWFWHVDVSTLHYVLGIAFALAPDLDFLVLYFRKGAIAMYRGHTVDHRDLLHHPLLFVSVGGAVVWLITGSSFLTALFAFCSITHFLHDSIGIGWGIRWISPFSMKNYKFFCDPDGTPSTRLVVSWNRHQRDEVVREKGDPNWMWDYFFRPFATGKITLFSTIEVIVPVLFVTWFVLVHW